ncbi:unnamed protein product [Bursaphelenchus xylophilus]|uniref:(pine wood nematode) hypothetical protein n=1 Tax=Bursaphelenchus xylophilus TaxID=6326 RepID=A0A1I7S520_BURXY|nr:unnamed protein product [Bursaphelenchus xylophilus]CAG9117615.1 unnamed protein product [Bursaphelenchus xylophilus]
MKLLGLVLIFSVIHGANSLRCLTCEGRDCDDLSVVHSEECPNIVRSCYSVSDDSQHLYQAGCAYTDCSRIRNHGNYKNCVLCDTDSCLPYNVNYKNRRQSNGIGTGASIGVRDEGNGVGTGAHIRRGNSVAATAPGVVSLAVAVFVGLMGR